MLKWTPQFQGLAYHEMSLETYFDLTYQEFLSALRAATAFGNEMSGSFSSGKITLRQGINGESGNTGIQDIFPKISQSSVANATVSNFVGGENDPKVSGTAVDSS